MPFEKSTGIFFASEMMANLMPAVYSRFFRIKWQPLLMHRLRIEPEA
jgi:hypothetical protein